MTQTEKIPCTIAILTRNSAATLREALDSVQDFAEIIVCDGNSTDETLAIAHAYGTKVITQDPQYLDESGRIRNYAGVRNQTLQAASYKWFFFLDSDEYLTQELVSEIRQVVSGEPAAYWVLRKYEYKGKVVDCAVTYPNVQMRFFNTLVTKAFIKEVHEKIELKDGVVPKQLQNYMLVPLPGTTEEQYAKWRRYLAIEKARRPPMSFIKWLGVAVHEVAIACLYLLRLIKIQLFCRGNKLPIRFELARVWYQWTLVRDSFSAIVRL